MADEVKPRKADFFTVTKVKKMVFAKVRSKKARDVNQADQASVDRLLSERRLERSRSRSQVQQSVTSQGIGAALRESTEDEKQEAQNEVESTKTDDDEPSISVPKAEEDERAEISMTSELDSMKAKNSDWETLDALHTLAALCFVWPFLLVIYLSRQAPHIRLPLPPLTPILYHSRSLRLSSAHEWPHPVWALILWPLTLLQLWLASWGCIFLVFEKRRVGSKASGEQEGWLTFLISLDIQLQQLLTQTHARTSGAVMTMAGKEQVQVMARPPSPGIVTAG